MKSRLLTPLYISSLILVLLVVGQGCLSILIGARRQQAAAWVTHTLLVEREGERLLSAALEQQTGLRGYLLTKTALS
jgi:CHASE3 domain sensor protein